MSENYFDRVRSFLHELDIEITAEDTDESLFVVSDEIRGVHNLVVDCEEGILVLEQIIFQLATDDASVLTRLLQMNRELVHGAFVLDESGRRVIFRDTLELENLDLNELEASINALGLALAAYSAELIAFSKAE